MHQCSSWLSLSALLQSEFMTSTFHSLVQKHCTLYPVSWSVKCFLNVPLCRFLSNSVCVCNPAVCPGAARASLESDKPSKIPTPWLTACLIRGGIYKPYSLDLLNFSKYLDVTFVVKLHYVSKDGEMLKSSISTVFQQVVFRFLQSNVTHFLPSVWHFVIQCVF